MLDILVILKIQTLASSILLVPPSMLLLQTQIAFLIVPPYALAVMPDIPSLIGVSLDIYLMLEISQRSVAVGTPETGARATIG